MLQSGAGQGSLGPYVGLFKEGWKTLLTVVLVFILAAAALSLLLPAGFSARARVQVLPLPPASDPPPINIATEAEVAESPVVARRVAAEATDLSATELREGVRVDAQLGSEVLDVVYTADSADAARSLADAFATAYIEERRALAERSIGVALDRVNERIAEVRSQLEGLERGASSRKGPSVQERVLFRSLNGLLDRRADLETSSAQLVGAVVIQPADKAEPTRSTVKNVLVAAVLGTGVGMGLLLMRPLLAGRFTSRHDLENAVGAPVLVEFDGVVSDENSYRRLAATVRTSLGAPSSRLLLAGLGRQDVLNRDALGLARALAETGVDTTLVLTDATGVHGAGGAGARSGGDLYEWLAGTGSVDEGLFRPTDLPKLMLIAGDETLSRKGLLLSQRFNLLLRHLGERPGVVLVGLPAMDFPAAISASPDVDAALVLLHDATRSDVVQAMTDLRRVGTIVVGCVWHRRAGE